MSLNNRIIDRNNAPRPAAYSEEDRSPIRRPQYVRSFFGIFSVMIDSSLSMIPLCFTFRPHIRNVIEMKNCFKGFLPKRYILSFCAVSLSHSFGRLASDPRLCVWSARHGSARRGEEEQRKKVFKIVDHFSALSCWGWIDEGTSMETAAASSSTQRSSMPGCVFCVYVHACLLCILLVSYLDFQEIWCGKWSFYAMAEWMDGWAVCRARSHSTDRSFRELAVWPAPRPLQRCLWAVWTQNSKVGDIEHRNRLIDVIRFGYSLFDLRALFPCEAFAPYMPYNKASGVWVIQGTFIIYVLLNQYSTVNGRLFEFSSCINRDQRK
jgi:hypothetical protein